MQIEKLKQVIANTPDGMHKKDLIRQLKRLYRKKRLTNGHGKAESELDTIHN